MFTQTQLQTSHPLPSVELRLADALAAMRRGRPVILIDDSDRENEADLIVAAENLTVPTMALLIRECSGIVCLCLTPDAVKELDLPPMVSCNESRFSTAFTVSIEARHGVTTGVSAADRVTTVQAAVADGVKPGDLVRPGHVFPLTCCPSMPMRDIPTSSRACAASRLPLAASSSYRAFSSGDSLDIALTKPAAFCM